MLFLLFEVDGDRYALDTAGVEQVLPLVELRRVPQAPAYIAGVFRHEDEVVPVVDTCRLLGDRAAVPLMSTRLVLARYDRGGAPRRLGLLVERATETVRAGPGDVLPPGVAVADAPFLGGMLPVGQGMAQLLHLDRLLPEELWAAMLAAEAP